MWSEIHNIDIYNNSEAVIMHKESKLYRNYLCIIGILFIGFIILIFNYRYSVYSNYECFIEGQKLHLYLTKEELKDFDSKKIILNEKEYDYQLIEVSQPSYDNNFNIYYEVIIEVNLKKSRLIDNKVLTIVTKDKSSTFVERIYKKIMKGMR